MSTKNHSSEGLTPTITSILRGSAPPLAPLDPLRRYSIDESARYLGISRATLYHDIAEGLILTIKDRKRRFVPGSEIVRRSQVA